MYKYEKLREYFTENYEQTELFLSDYELSEIMDVAREELKIAREKANGVDPTNAIALPIPIVMPRISHFIDENGTTVDLNAEGINVRLKRDGTLEYLRSFGFAGRKELTPVYGA
jgi:hypothetical protein